MNQALKRLNRAIRKFSKIFVIGSGPSVELLSPELLKDAALITVNHAALFVQPTIQVAVDSWGIEPIFKTRGWDRTPCLWVWKEETLSHSPSAAKFLDKNFISINSIWETDICEKLRGSGATAVWLGWLLARETRKELVTIGIDMGLLYPSQEPIRYAPSMYPEEFRKQHQETRKGKIPIDHKREGTFIPNAYPGQQSMLTELARIHRDDTYRPVTSNMSCINWTRLIDGTEAAIDHGIVTSVLEKIELTGFE